VLPLSIVGEIVLKLSTRIGYRQIWPHKIQLGQNWLQAPLQEGVEDQSTTVDCGSTLTAQQKERKSFTKRNTKTALVLCLAVLGTAIEARAAQANSKR
jgi:hypothetical protein